MVIFFPFPEEEEFLRVQKIPLTPRFLKVMNTLLESLHFW